MKHDDNIVYDEHVEHIENMEDDKNIKHNESDKNIAHDETSENSNRCINCGVSFNETDSFCVNCGMRLTVDPADERVNDNICTDAPLYTNQPVIQPIQKHDREEFITEKSIKLKLLGYALLSFLSFTYLIIPAHGNPGISVPVFIILQFMYLYFIIPEKKALWMFIPIFILSANSFISGNGMWKITNFLVIIVLYSAMFFKINIFDTSAHLFGKITKNIFDPFKYFNVPFKWCGNIGGDEKKVMKRVFIGFCITIPVLFVLIILLASADSVFSNIITDILNHLDIDIVLFRRIVIGACAGLYLFGLIYAAYGPKSETKAPDSKDKQGDLIILNILLVSILIIYTIFIIIQFKYLFAGSSLPYGLTYQTYARKGFFELLFLTGANIFIILLTIYLTKNKQGSWFKMTKSLCLYLCAVTIILLISSFYRMWLFNADDGLTRLRFMVFGFLIFESIGLFITFFYIIKPNFNIILVYSSITLVYYLFLNIVPMDYYVAKSQVDLYFKDNGRGASYALSLSSDAAPQIKRLLDTNLKTQADVYFENLKQKYDAIEYGWRQYNFSVEKAVK